ncbi:MAG: hypothetical protein GWP75_04685, partial [Planctomycetia bacterium]|nr:hypothetical protein [Planctomycetia bacterium]
MERSEDERPLRQSGRGSSDVDEFASVLRKHWIDILETPPEEQSDFVRCGGSSLDLLELQLRLLREHAVLLDLSRLPDSLTFDVLIGSVERVAVSQEGLNDSACSPCQAVDFVEGPANSAQIEQWIAEKIQPGSCEYLVPVRVEVPEGTTWEALESALVAVINAHPSLRTSIHNIDRGDSGFVQRIHPPVHSSGLIPRSTVGIVNDLPGFLRSDSILIPTVESEHKCQAIGLVGN